MVDCQTIDIVKKLHDDFPTFTETCLKIKDKSGTLIPFKLNTVQRYVHNLIEKQKAEKGYVRVLNLKSRQQGLSTMIGGRGYHKTAFNAGQKAVVIAHSQDTANELFNKIQIYQSNINLPIKTTRASAKEIVFDGLNSSFSVMSAGSKEIGRGHTINFLHASETPFWDNAEMHIAGLLQAVPSGDFIYGTEIIFESTANGASGVFYNMWQEAMAGKSDYIAIFVPWFMSEEYTQVVPEGFILDSEEENYKNIYNLTLGQMVWRRQKIKDLGNDLDKFKQEYPANAVEAFRTSGVSFINPTDVLEARHYKGNIITPIGAPIIGGLDLSFSSDGDRTIFAMRVANEIKVIEQWPNTDETGELVTMITEVFNRYNLDMLFIDAGAGGKVVYNWLKTVAPMLAIRVIPIDFGGKSTNPDLYHNKRAEMSDRLRQWFINKPCKIPNSDDLQSDILALERKKDAPRHQLTMKSKAEIRKTHHKSTDILDACLLLFAQPDHYVYSRMNTQQVPHYGYDGNQSKVGRHGY
jgi:hypothetical protein